MAWHDIHFESLGYNYSAELTLQYSLSHLHYGIQITYEVIANDVFVLCVYITHVQCEITTKPRTETVKHAAAITTYARAIARTILYIIITVVVRMLPACAGWLAMDVDDDQHCLYIVIGTKAA